MALQLGVAGVRETVTVFAPRAARLPIITSATRIPTPLRDVPQAVSIVSSAVIRDHGMRSMADVVRYMPGVGMAQGEGNRDTPILRGHSSTADFFLDGIRDDVQYFRDVYNVERVEALKGPNAMIFGRGGAGGVINRVTRRAEWEPIRELAVEGGSFGRRRMTGDFGQGFGDRVAARLTGMFEDSRSYRNGVGVQRYGVNPTVAFAPGAGSIVRVSYERFRDDRVADRGISSFDGRPLETDARTFFGDPDQSRSTATVDLAAADLEHRLREGVTLRSRFGYGVYDKFYQNVFPGAVNAAGTTVSISAYNNATERTNLFSQTDLAASGRTGPIGHTVLAGVELGRQVTDNVRNTGYFISVGSTVTSVAAPIDAPTISLPVEFRPSASDANNHGVATVVAAYVQDQASLSRLVQVVAGVRVDRFAVTFQNNRTGQMLQTEDAVVSPRFGVIVKPAEAVSLYGSYGRSYVPRAGEQLASLTPTNTALDPETFRNVEVGAKWETVSGLSLSAAVYRLNRGNVAGTDPADPTRSILVDAQRTTGLELELNGQITAAWSVLGGYAWQDGEITHAISASAPTGAAPAQVPPHAFSLWTRYDVSARLGVGFGVQHRGQVFTSTDNRVTVPRFTRADLGVFFVVSRWLRAQVNVENLFDAAYYASAHSNTNITPGSPRALRVAIAARF
jgi:catecholate siderophore receptor